MNQGQTIFSQIMNYIPKHKFDFCIKKNIEAVIKFNHSLVGNNFLLWLLLN